MKKKEQKYEASERKRRGKIRRKKRPQIR